jgi:hypothetical protein
MTPGEGATPTGPTPPAPAPRDAGDAWDSLAADPADLDPTGSAAHVEDDVDGEDDRDAAELADDPPESDNALTADEADAARGSGWTIPMMCAGIALIACCVLIPQADANRRMAYEREKLRLDLESTRKQVAVNGEFLKKVAGDPNLAERLAQRQMKIIREGTKVLKLRGQEESGQSMSPFHLVAVSPPPPVPEYKPVGGRFAGLFYRPRTRLYLMGGGLMLMAAGLVLGFGRK